MTIQRWEIRNGFRGEDAYKHEDGPYVWYTDHQATVARYEARLAEDAKVRDRLVATLESISTVSWRNFDAGFRGPQSFVDWAKSIANDALAAAKGIE